MVNHYLMSVYMNMREEINDCMFVNSLVPAHLYMKRHNFNYWYVYLQNLQISYLKHQCLDIGLNLEGSLCVEDQLDGVYYLCKVPH